jgi:hypothetical protein
MAVFKNSHNIFNLHIFKLLEIFEEFFNLNPGVLESRGITKRQCRSVEGGYAAAHLRYTSLRLESGLSKKSSQRLLPLPFRKTILVILHGPSQVGGSCS